MRSAVHAVLLCAFLSVSCGKKGPPLPPLVKLPVAPADLTAARRGDSVDLQLTIPSTNTDTSRPANIARVEVYALTGPPNVPEADILKRGTKVASLAVKSPRDPDATTDPDDPDQSEADVDPPEGPGLDQGAVARVQETLSASARTATDIVAAPPADTDPNRPLLGPVPAVVAARTYIGVSVTAKGRRGQVSKRVVVPLSPSPPAPATPRVTYTETEVTVAWRPTGPTAVQSPATAGVLPARLIGVTAPRLAYHVYEVPAPAVASGAAASIRAGVGPQTQLTKTPIADATFADTRMTWGAARCYAVRAIEIVDALAVESEETSPVCVTLVDTFAPGAPKGLNAVASGEGAINLIWDANPEPDLDGYLVFRAVSPNTTLTRITPMPIHETNFRDTVQPGVRYIYALQAIDKAGNPSPMSDRQEETAR